MRAQQVKLNRFYHQMFPSLQFIISLNILLQQNIILLFNIKFNSILSIQNYLRINKIQRDNILYNLYSNNLFHSQYASNAIDFINGIPQSRSETPYSLFCPISPNTKLMQRIISSAARAASKSAIQSQNYSFRSLLGQLHQIRFDSSWSSYQCLGPNRSYFQANGQLFYAP